jgi:hypothetical protein
MGLPSGGSADPTLRRTKSRDFWGGFGATRIRVSNLGRDEVRDRDRREFWQLMRLKKTWDPTFISVFTLPYEVCKLNMTLFLDVIRIWKAE